MQQHAIEALWRVNLNLSRADEEDYVDRFVEEEEREARARDPTYIASGPAFKNHQRRLRRLARLALYEETERLRKEELTTEQLHQRKEQLCSPTKLVQLLRERAKTISQSPTQDTVDFLDENDEVEIELDIADELGLTTLDNEDRGIEMRDNGTEEQQQQQQQHHPTEQQQHLTDAPIAPIPHWNTEGGDTPVGHWTVHTDPKVFGNTSTTGYDEMLNMFFAYMLEERTSPGTAQQCKLCEDDHTVSAEDKLRTWSNLSHLTRHQNGAFHSRLGHWERAARMRQASDGVFKCPYGGCSKSYQKYTVLKDHLYSQRRAKGEPDLIHREGMVADGWLDGDFSAGKHDEHQRRRRKISDQKVSERRIGTLTLKEPDVLAEARPAKCARTGEPVPGVVVGPAKMPTFEGYSGVVWGAVDHSATAGAGLKTQDTLAATRAWEQFTKGKQAEGHYTGVSFGPNKSPYE